MGRKKPKAAKTQAHVTSQQNGSHGNSASNPRNVNLSAKSGGGQGQG